MSFDLTCVGYELHSENGSTYNYTFTGEHVKVLRIQVADDSWWVESVHFTGVARCKVSSGLTTIMLITMLADRGDKVCKLYLRKYKIETVLNMSE